MNIASYKWWRGALGVLPILPLALLGSTVDESDRDQPIGSARLSLLMADNFESLKLVSWRVEEGNPDDRNPLLEPEMPWDSGGVMAHGTVLCDPIDGLWKAWQISTPGETALDGLNSRHEHQRRLTYLESKDGVNWYRPELSLVQWPGYDRTNILLDFESGGTAAYASVFVTPSNREWPYEMFILRSPALAGTGNHVGTLPGPSSKLGGYRYRSKDGKDWRVIEGPLQVSGAGGGSFSYIHREPGGGYSAFLKSYQGMQEGDRIIPYDTTSHGSLRRLARRMSLDGRTWNVETPVLGRDWRDADYAQFMELCPIKVRGGYVAMITAYNAANQTTYLELAASRDGINWWRPDRRPALPNPPLGDYGGGMMWQMHHPIVEGNLLHVYYAGSEGLQSEIFDTRFKPHLAVGNEMVIGSPTPSLPYNTALCRASWRFDRLWALVSSAGGVTLGEAVTKPDDISGYQLAVNVRVKNGGVLRAELLDTDNQPVPGFTFEECDSITGDHLQAIFSWKGEDLAPTAAVKIRFQLHRALLYGFDWINPTST